MLVAEVRHLLWGAREGLTLFLLLPHACRTRHAIYIHLQNLSCQIALAESPATAGPRPRGAEASRDSRARQGLVKVAFFRHLIP